jgi:hypothetical protein
VHGADSDDALESWSETAEGGGCQAGPARRQLWARTRTVAGLRAGAGLQAAVRRRTRPGSRGARADFR